MPSLLPARVFSHQIAAAMDGATGSTSHLFSSNFPKFGFLMPLIFFRTSNFQ